MSVENGGPCDCILKTLPQRLQHFYASGSNFPLLPVYVHEVLQRPQKTRKGLVKMFVRKKSKRKYFKVENIYAINSYF